MTHPESPAAALPPDQLKQVATEVADALKAVPSADAAPAQTGGGSRHRGLPEDLRQRFIAVRTALFTRGIYDPVLVRFDTATVPQAATNEIAEALATVAAAL